MKYDFEGAIKLMEDRGYKYTATNGDKTILFFLKEKDPKIILHATVFIETQKLDLDNAGLLHLGVTIYREAIFLEDNKFEDFEESLYNYTYLCTYGKQPGSPMDSAGSRNESVVKQQESKTPDRSVTIGGDVKGEGKPVKPTIEERKKKFWDIIKQVGKEKGLEKEMCKSFWDYWTEMNPGGKKMRFEMEKIFDVSRRLRTWLDNDKKWLPIWKQKEQEKAKTEEKQLKNTNKNLKKYEDLF